MTAHLWLGVTATLLSLLCLHPHPAVAFITGPCAAGCGETFCDLGLGCHVCKDNWCKKIYPGLTIFKSVCVVYCGKGFLCSVMPWGTKVCMKCVDPNCEICSTKFKCDKCKESYKIGETKNPNINICEKVWNYGVPK